MDLGRGALAKIDRKVLSGLGHDERYQMVRVPVSKAVWSTWKRYCEAVELPMGRAIVALIHHELRSVVDNLDGASVFLAQLERAATERQAALDVRERQLSAQEERLRVQQRQIVPVPIRFRPATQAAKVGRNDPCPCGSGLKYKRCHGV